MGTNKGLSEKELLNVINKLETALNNVVDKAEEALNSNNNTTGGNNTSVVTSRAFKHLSSSNPYDENKRGEKRKFKEYEKYAQDRSKMEDDIQKEKIANEMSFWKMNKQQIAELSKYENDLQLKRQQAEIDFFRDKEDEIRELDELEVSLMKARHEKDLKARKRALELEKKTTDDKGRTKSNREWEEAKANWNQNTTGRKAGIITSKALGGAAKAIDFLGSDKKVSISDIGNKVADVAGNFGPWGKAAGALVQIVTAVVEAYDKVNAAASKYSRIVGGGLTKMTQMKTDSTMIANEITSWGGNAYKFDDILEHITELSSKTGRIMDHMSAMDIKSLEDLTRYGVNSDTLNMYDTFGLSLEEIDKRITSVYKTSGRHGLNAKAVTDTINKNLKLAQQYTFAGGQRALERMAEKSVALKYNIEAAARFADKVSTLEGAAQVGAQLSVLGGDFARMGNPLSLLYGGLQDPERLNDMMLNMTKNMAHWDSQNREMRIDAYNRQRLKAAADAMGVDYSDLISQAMNQGKRNRIDSQISNSITDEDTREYIRNLAQLDENGKAYIRFSGDKTPTYLDKLTPESKEKLQKESEAMEQKDKVKIGDVWEETRTITDKLNDYIQWMKTKMFELILKIASGTDEEKAKNKGLNSKNAEMFEDFSDDYANGGINERSKIALKKLGASDKDIEKAANKGFESQEEFDNWLINVIKKKQDEGYTYKGNSWFFDYAYTHASHDDWFDKNFTKTDVKKQAHGGIVRGTGTSKSDSIPTMLSAGEYVVPSDVAQEHMPQLNAWRGAKGYADGGSVIPDKLYIKAGSNQYNHMNVSESAFDSARMSAMMKAIGTTGNSKVAIDPININISGTINLTGGGNTKSFDVKDIMNNPTIISQLVRRIEESVNYGLDKHKVHMKYPEPIIV